MKNRFTEATISHALTFSQRLTSTTMQVQHNEAAAWADLDWGVMEAEPTPLSEPEVMPVEKQAQLPATPAALKQLPSTLPLPKRTETLAQLTLTLADGRTQEIAVSGELFTVGRKSDNDLAIKDLHVSGAHARLILMPNGAYELHDLGSSGGTIVNDEEINGPRQLISGDWIEFATVRALFEYIAGPPVEDAMEFGSTLPHTRKKVVPKKAAASVPRQPRLVIAMPDGATLTVEIAGQMTIGRLETNDIVIPQDNVSSQHARLICHPGGIVELIDLNSTCGTFVNGMAIAQKSLAGGEKLRFGVVEALFETPASLAKAAGVPEAVPALIPAKESPLPMPKRPQGWK